MKRRGETALATIMLGVLTALILTISAFGQQEVDPTWYDPWAKSAAATVRQTKESAREHKKVTLASARPKQKNKSRGADTHRDASRVETALPTK